MTSISFGSMFNPERVSANKTFNPERNIEGFAYGDSERPKDFPALPVDYGYRDSKNFWFHRKTRMRAELLQMRKEVAPHCRLHPHTDDVTVILNKVTQKEADDIEGKNDNPRNHNGTIHLARDVDVEHIVGNDGVDHPDRGNQEGGKHIQEKEALVRSIIGNKTL